MRLISFLLVGCLALPVLAQNTKIASYAEAKKIALAQVYYDHLTTFYCGATIGADKKLILPEGFTTPKYEKRSTQLEWEHVVPVEALGKRYKAWRKDLQCYTSNGKLTQGRKCMNQVADPDYQFMQADLYNLYPSIGAVNAMRSNSPFAELPHVPNTFGSCEMKIYKHQVEPPDRVKGTIARTYLYMADTYKFFMEDSYQPYYEMDEDTKKLMLSWDEKFPPDAWECERAKRIHKVQGNANKFVEGKCLRNYGA